MKEINDLKVLLTAEVYLPSDSIKKKNGLIYTKLLIKNLSISANLS